MSELNATKKQRLSCEQAQADKQVLPNDQSNIYHQVLNRQDYLTSICIFLSVQDLVQTIPLLSQDHHNILNNNHESTIHMLKSLVSYDFGELCSKYNISLAAKESKSSLNIIAQIYDDWDYLELKTGDLFPSEINFAGLMKLQKYECIRHWFIKVKNLLILSVLCIVFGHIGNLH